MSEALKRLREIQAQEDEERLSEAEEIILSFLNTHPDGKPLYPMDEKEFNDYLEFTHAVNTAEKIEKRRQKKAASDALNEIIKDPLSPESDDDEPEETSEKDKEEIPEKTVIKPNAKKPCFKPDDVSKSKDTDLGR